MTMIAGKINFEELSLLHALSLDLRCRLAISLFFQENFAEIR